ncbi:MAG: tyrosine--tRNA ligase [Methanomicrobiales archaeon]|nr:tyrosine--tRNA ligase [Methanomicrobiales archaeon]
MDEFSLVARNTVEVITEEELRLLLESPRRRVYAGYEPSGEIHLGHLVTVQKLLDMQQAGFEVTLLLADLHAFLNRKGTLEEVAELAEYNRRCFEALGLHDVHYALGSDLQLRAEYELMVLRLSQQITLNRAARSMDEVGRQMENPTVSQMIYPIMQMVDIAMLGVDAAVGGIDQRKIHMLAREYLPSIGYPAPLCVHTPILLGLDGEKMSSSKGNYISIADGAETILKKMERAFCPPATQGNPVLQMMQYHVFPRFAEVVIRRPKKYGGDRMFGSYAELEVAYAEGRLHPQDLKKACACYLAEMLAEVRDRMGR